MIKQLIDGVVTLWKTTLEHPIATWFVLWMLSLFLKEVVPLFR